MSENNLINIPSKDISSAKDFERLYNDGVLKIRPFTLIRNSINGKVFLVIGYKKILDNQFAYLVSDTENGPFALLGDCFYFKASDIENTKIYHRLGRKDVKSIALNTPSEGDTVVCIAKDRYVGAKFGELYKVQAVDKECRITIEKGSEYSYEFRYFIVVRKPIEPIIDSSGSLNNTLSVKDTSNNIIIGSNPTSKMTFDSSATRISFKTIDFTDDGIIHRRKISEEPERHREIYDVKLIHRNKLKHHKL